MVALVGWWLLSWVVDLVEQMEAPEGCMVALVGWAVAVVAVATAAKAEGLAGYLLWIQEHHDTQGIWIVTEMAIAIAWPAMAESAGVPVGLLVSERPAFLAV